MAHFCWFPKYIFLLLMIFKAYIIETRPTRQSDLISGNEFLKLFFNHDELQRNLHSSENIGHAESSSHLNNISTTSIQSGNRDNREVSGHSLEHMARYRNPTVTDASKQVVKLVTTGSKIIFLEEYDEDDAIIDAVAREIDLKREPKKTTRKAHLGNEVKVVAVSSSSSSKQGDSVDVVNKYQISSTTKTTRTTVKAPPTTRGTVTEAPTVDFINRSHKSEFSIEEVEPLTMLKYIKHVLGQRDVMKESDSLNSASTNIQNVLAAPLVSVASNKVSVAAYYSGRNSSSLLSPELFASADINHSTLNTTTPASFEIEETAVGLASEEKLLPFQTVIYHDTKLGHGPQSRSISYSSLSQNIEDLHAWRKSVSILAEAQRNVSESLKTISRTAMKPQQHYHTSEQAKFYLMPSKIYTLPSKVYSEPVKAYSESAQDYSEPEKVYSEPSKVYSEPSKFYSEPAKVYSQPVKIYGEPSKIYWSQSLTTANSTTTTQRPKISTILTTTALPVVTLPLTGVAPTTYLPSRKPVIVSRIAFGEAQKMTLTSITTSASSTPSTMKALSSTMQSAWQQTQTEFYHNQQHRQQNNEHRHHQSVKNSQPRRVLFNLDKLPYDLLNAPEHSSRHLFESIISKQRPTIELTEKTPSFSLQQKQRQQSQQQQQLQEPQKQKQQQLAPCSDTTSSSLSITQQQQRQYSSVSVQRSNQNAKELPNRDLVKCIVKYAHSKTNTDVASSSYTLSPVSAGRTSHQHFTTERSNSEEGLYTPTPEQNYEIEESVSVMTNGRTHSVQGNIGPKFVTTPSTIASVTITKVMAADTATKTMQRNRQMFGVADARSRGSVTYNTNANADDYDDNQSYHYNENGDAAVASIKYEQAGTSTSAEENKGVSETGETNAGTNADGEDSKVAAYVVEGRNYRKYRVEEKTDDGFIVGEYGVVDHNDGNLRGVRYTADSTINRSLIQKALLTFLKLK